ncbi:MAG: dephospho-CoA kinase [Clostridiales bacterium]|nr:dephospho-CoA kinase [Clostridiales bacterium]
MNTPTKVIGLTGLIGSGKSLAAAILAGLGACVVNADLIAREITAPGLPAAREIAAVFGPGYFTADGQLDRALLGMEIFSNITSREKLNRITHPRIYAAAREEISRLRRQAVPFICLEAAILLEIGLDELCDEVWLISTEKEQIIKRVALRDNLNQKEIEARLAAQPGQKELVSKVNRIIFNNKKPEDFRRNLEKIWQENNNE